jgi:hypothetical protein
MEPGRPFSPPPSPTRKRAGGTRILSVQIAVFATIVATAVALIVYFTLRG